MSDLTSKFAGLQSQLATQHAQVLELLGWLRQDVADIKSDVDNIRVSAANGATWGQQTASNTLDIYNRLNTLVALYSYLTQESEQGHDLIARINDLQYRMGLIQDYTDGLEGLIDDLFQPLADLLDELTRVRVSVAPTTQSSLYTRVNSMAGWLNVIYQATTGNVGSWTGTTIMQYLSTINAGVIQTSDGVDLAGQTLGDILAEVIAIEACACAEEPTDPCLDGTPLDVEIPGAAQQLTWVNPQETELLGTLSPLQVTGWFTPTLAGGPEGNYMRWQYVNGIYHIGTAGFCIQNGSEFATVYWFIFHAEVGDIRMERGFTSPGVTDHFAGDISGPNTWLALGLEQVPTDLDKIKIVVFAAG